MNPIGMIAVAAVCLYLCRGSGFALNLKSASPTWEAFLHFVPIAVFSALMLLALVRAPEFLNFKLLTLAFAGGVVWRTRQFGLAVIGGLGVLWILILLGGSPI